MWEWLIQPIDPSRAHDVGAMVSWHGRFMVLAWGVLVPTGILAARFFKRLPRQEKEILIEDKSWWLVHQIAQYSALILTGFGALLIYFNREAVPSLTERSSQHFYLGWAIVILSGLQLCSGWLRGTKGGPTDPRGLVMGDHYLMTPRRLLFERIHKTMGYSLLFLAAVTVLTGLWQANAPHWMWLGIFLWWALLLQLAAFCTWRGMVLDTYHAIWGIDPSLPGNERAQRLRGKRPLFGRNRTD